MTESSAFASFEAKWLSAHPHAALVRIFLAPADRTLVAAFGCFAFELEQAAFHLREPQVAATKLNWWADELARSSAGTPRHPICQTLFADARAQALPGALWQGAVHGALTQLESAPCADFAAQLAQIGAFAAPLAALEARLLAPASTDSGGAARLWAGSLLLRQTLHLAHAPSNDRLAVPLALLARHQLQRVALATDSPARTALLRDYLALLDDEIKAGLVDAPAASLMRRVGARLERWQMRRARRAADVLARLGAGGGEVRTLWYAWREARRGR